MKKRNVFFLILLAAGASVFGSFRFEVDPDSLNQVLLLPEWGQGWTYVQLNNIFKGCVIRGSYFVDTYSEGISYFNISNYIAYLPSEAICKERSASRNAVVDPPENAIIIGNTDQEGKDVVATVYVEGEQDYAIVNSFLKIKIATTENGKTTEKIYNLAEIEKTAGA